jgi:hypothetical protein
MVGALYLVRPVLAMPMRAFVLDASLGLANPARASALRQLDCIDFGIDPPVPSPSASIVSSPFVYVFEGLDCVDLGIAPFHHDCLDASPSSLWRPLCACSSIDTATRPQLRRSWPSSARLLRPSAGPSAALMWLGHQLLQRGWAIGCPGYCPFTLGYLDIGTKVYHLLEQPCGFPLQPQHLRGTDRCDCVGKSCTLMYSAPRLRLIHPSNYTNSILFHEKAICCDLFSDYIRMICPICFAYAYLPQTLDRLI